MLLLRCSGLRISDASTVRRSRVRDGRLFLYAAKTDVPVFTLLPQFVIDALDACPLSDDFYFWSGNSSIETVAGDWRRSLSKLFKLVPLEQVSMLLGQTSIRITERHYAPWVRSRQDQLEAAVRHALAHDPIAFSETKGTSEAHRDNALLN